MFEFIFIYGWFFLIGGFVLYGVYTNYRDKKIKETVIEELVDQSALGELLEYYKPLFEQLENDDDQSFAQRYGSRFAYRGPYKELNGSPCPECETGHLYVRKGSYGTFLGCSNYPRCKHTESIQNAKASFKEKTGNEIATDFEKAYEV